MFHFTTNEIQILKDKHIIISSYTVVSSSGVYNYFTIKDVNGKTVGEFLWDENSIIVSFNGNIPQYVELEKFLEGYGFKENKIITLSDNTRILIKFT